MTKPYGYNEIHPNKKPFYIYISLFIYLFLLLLLLKKKLSHTTIFRPAHAHSSLREKSPKPQQSFTAESGGGHQSSWGSRGIFISTPNMVNYMLMITGELENLTNLQPQGGCDDPDFTYYFKVPLSISSGFFFFFFFIYTFGCREIARKWIQKCHFELNPLQETDRWSLVCFLFWLYI